MGHEVQGGADADLVGFGHALDALLAEVQADLGPQDVAHLEQRQRLSRRLELLGRAMILCSVEPVSFFCGVLALSTHKMLSIEIGHMVLHGAVDRLQVAEQWRSKDYKWDNLVSEEAWRFEHNVLHHGFTGVVGKDPDADWGVWRTVETIPHRLHHRFQVPLILLFVVPNSWAVINGHVTGLADTYTGRARVLRNRSFGAKVWAHRLAMTKYARYLGKEYLFWPMLAGPLFPKVVLGNFLAGTVRDVWSAAVILIGHVGDPITTPQAIEPSKGRGDFYRRQVEATRNFTTSRWVSWLHADLQYHIEHHLFPRVPFHRLPRLAPRVRELCRAHGVRYTSEPLGEAIKSAFRTYLRLSRPRGVFAANPAAR